ncbi:YkgJ family cysteine cluster protein [Anatilimnocola sp. NA78]|uniref:YkgJ family cysteine cluster protein n=1 Tax=Anatilimnocola sp. NA78 TaxID=3415683 RepID=UPI003CE54A06
MTTEVANIHVDVRGKTHLVPISFELGEQPLSALLPFAQQLTEQLTKIAIEHEEQAGKTVSCHAGCGACCRQVIVISFVEAEGIAAAIAKMPIEKQQAIRQRFDDAISRLEAAGLLDPGEQTGERSLVGVKSDSPASAAGEVARRYFEQQIACPFLENESCGIYADRPLVCREYHVTSPAANCQRIYQIGVDRVEVPVNMGGQLTRTAHQLTGEPLQMLTLVLLLEWLSVRPSPSPRTFDGLQLVQALVTDMNRTTGRQ